MRRQEIQSAEGVRVSAAPAPGRGQFDHVTHMGIRQFLEAPSVDHVSRGVLGRWVTLTERALEHDEQDPSIVPASVTARQSEFQQARGALDQGKSARVVRFYLRRFWSV